MTNGEMFEKVFHYSVHDIPYVHSERVEWADEKFDPPISEVEPKPFMDYTLSELFHELYDEMNERSQ